MPFERLRALTGTLRFRLTAWTCLVVAATVALTLVIVREGLRQSLLAELDARLREDVEEVRLNAQQFGPQRDKFRDELRLKAQGHAAHGWFVQLLTPEGEPIWATENAPALDLPARATERVTFRSAASYRVAQRRLDSPGGRPRIVRVGTSLRPVDEDIEQLTDVLLTAGAAALVVIPLLAYWLAGRATRPLAEIIATASRLEPSNMHDRLALRHSGDELDRLCATINGLLDRIAAYIGQNRDFLANAAHELRSPLAAIRSSVEVTLDRGRTEKEYAALLGDIAEECSNMGLLISQLLLLAEGEAGPAKGDAPAADLADLVRRSLEMFQGVAESRRVALEAPRLCEVRVAGERHHLRQVVNNLLDNAIKYTPAGGRVTVDLGPDAAGAFAVLRVRDTGVGIAPEDLPRLFERFFRCDRARSRESARRGNGLGLSICEAIVKSLGGKITVESAVGRGSEFTVFLPAEGGSKNGVGPV